MLFFSFISFFLLSLTDLKAVPLESQELSSPEVVLKGDLPASLKSRSSRGLHLKPFPVIYRPEVTRWIQFFSQEPSPYIKLWLKRSYRYFPMMEEIFQARGLPKELVSMSLVESSLSPQAVSSAQAVGYWQFIKPTGLEFGLRINHWIDERRDFRKSTLAASKYLYQLYEEFENWLLAMSAYNMGSARLNRLIEKHQTRDFWTLYKKSDFPRETALYIPKILAAAHIIRNPARYGLNDFPVLSPHSFDIFFLPGGTDLRKVSSDTKIPLTKIKALNPDLKKSSIPSSIAFHQVRIPKGTGLLFSKWLDKQSKSN